MEDHENAIKGGRVLYGKVYFDSLISRDNCS